MLKKLLSVIIVFCIQHVQAQDAFFSWVKTIGSTDQDITRYITRSRCGDLYVSGLFRGTVDMDPGAGIQNLVSSGGSDIFINKYDAFGNLLWAKRIGGSADENAGIIKEDINGNIYFLGSFNGTADVDPGPGVTIFTSGASSTNGVFLVKLDADGNFIWGKLLADKGDISVHTSFDLSPSGNIYVAASFSGTCDLDPGPGIFNLTSTATGQWSDIFISKLDSDGNFIWARQFSGSLYKFAKSLVIDSQENITVAGDFFGTVDFDPGPAVFDLSTSLPALSVFIVRLDNNGNFTWAKQIVGNNAVNTYGIDIDASANVYLSGGFYGHIDFDPGPGTFYLDSYGGDPSAFILKITASGDLALAQRLGGQASIRGSCTAFDIALDDAGNIYATGTFAFTVDFSDWVTLTTASADMFVIKLKPNGNFEYVKQVGGSSSSQALGESLTVDHAGNILVAGVFYDVIDFDPGPAMNSIGSNGITDAFILKLRQCDQPTYDTITKTICSGTYSLDCKTYSTSGIYDQLFINAAGCDSIVSLHLTFGKDPVPDLGPDKEQCIDSTDHILLKTQESYASYEWSTGLTTSTISVPNNIAEYWVKVKDTIGCEGADTIRIVPKQCVIDFFMPSAFSPNNDGLNDVLKPGVYGTLSYFKMEVFNRFGQVIFRSEDLAHGWDGKFKGTAAPVGVYVWQCYYQFRDKGLEYQKGTVTLIR